jgi:hypothetical protein
MPENIDFGNLAATGEGSCIGGQSPDPPLDDFPLLAFSGGVVCLGDGSATVVEIATRRATMSDPRAIAARYHTTEEYVTQAIDYAIKAGWLS